MRAGLLRAIVPVTGALCLALHACGSSTTEGARATVAPVAVQTVVATRGAITRRVSLPAYRILPLQAATLNAKVSGYLKSLTVDKGDVVQAGQLLAEIEVPEILADEAQYAAETDVARTTYQRMAQARDKAPDLVVPQTLDDLRGRWEIARAKLQRARTMLEYARLTAPFAGVITARFVDPGAFIPAATSGSTQGAALVTLMDVSRLRVQVFVPESEVRFIRDGMPVQVVLDEIPQKPFAGTVARSSYALDEATKTMLVEIEIPNRTGELRPGMYASVQFEMERKEDALLLPASAVATEKSGSFVFRVVDGRVEKTPVRIGFRDGARVEVADGLIADQPVVLMASQPLSDHQAVAVTEGK